MNKSIIILLISLSFINCTKESHDDHVHMEPVAIQPEPTEAAPSVVALADYYEPFANMSLVDEAMDLAIELGVEEVMVGIDDVAIYALPSHEVSPEDANEEQTAYYRYANSHITKSFVDGVESARLYLPATNVQLEEGTYMVLGANVDAWTIIHEMMHHYRYTNRAEIDGKFGGVNYDFSEPFYGEFGAIVINGYEWPVTESFEYALGVAVGTQADQLSNEILEYFANEFGI